MKMKIEISSAQVKAKPEKFNLLNWLANFHPGMLKQLAHERISESLSN